MSSMSPPSLRHCGGTQEIVQVTAPLSRLKSILEKCWPTHTQDLTDQIWPLPAALVLHTSLSVSLTWWTSVVYKRNRIFWGAASHFKEQNQNKAKYFIVQQPSDQLSPFLQVSASITEVNLACLI